MILKNVQQILKVIFAKRNFSKIFFFDNLHPSFIIIIHGYSCGENFFIPFLGLEIHNLLMKDLRGKGGSSPQKDLCARPIFLEFLDP